MGNTDSTETPQCQNIGGWRFEKQSREWILAKPSNEKLMANKWVLVTYNVWFDKESFKIRNKEIFRLFKERGADVICLQEVNQRFTSMLLQEDWITDYHLSDVDQSVIGAYGTIIISKHPFTSVERVSFPSNMNRDLLVATYQVNGAPLVCATVHLESLDSKKTRREQLEISHQFLKSSSNALLVGDFNFDSDINYSQLQARRQMPPAVMKDPTVPYPSAGSTPLENSSFLEIFDAAEGWRDLWPVLHDTEKGYTFDTEKNQMLWGFEQMRYDRIVFRSAEKKWVAKRLDMLGTTPIEGILTEEGDRPLFPSDHFGLEVELEWTDSEF